MPSGGERRPTNPAPVSGPGSLSARTDGKQPMMQLPDADYGEQKAYQDQQAGAPMAQSQPIPTAQSGAGGQAAPSVIPLNAPSARPDEPVTSGAAMGPGPGKEALGLPTMDDKDYTQKLRSYMPVLNFLANTPGASPSTQALVKELNSKV